MSQRGRRIQSVWANAWVTWLGGFLGMTLLAWLTESDEEEMAPWVMGAMFGLFCALVAGIVGTLLELVGWRRDA